MSDYPDSEIRLRSVDRSDLSLLLAHRNTESTRRWLENEFAVTPAQQNAWYEGGGAAGFRIAERGGLPVGLGRIDPSDNNEVLVGLDVFEEFRGKGLGHVIFRAVCVEAEKSGGRLVVWVFTENLAAVSIYRRSGFVEDRNVPVRYLARVILDGDSGETHPYVKLVCDR